MTVDLGFCSAAFFDSDTALNFRLPVIVKKKKMWTSFKGNRHVRDMGHFAMESRRKGKGQGKGRDESKGHAQANLLDTREDFREIRKAGDTKERCWTCGRFGHKSAECRWGVAGIEEEDADCRRSGGQLEPEEDGKVGGVWIAGNVWNSRKRKKAPAAVGADPCSGHMKTNAMNHAKIREGRRDRFSKICEDRREGFSKIRELVMTGSPRVRSKRRAIDWRRHMGRRMRTRASSLVC